MIEAERIRLRPLTFDDAAFILRLLNEPSFLQYIGDKGVRDLEQAKTYLENGPMASQEKHGFALDCIELKESGTPIGLLERLGFRYERRVRLSEGQPEIRLYSSDIVYLSEQ